MIASASTQNLNRHFTGLRRTYCWQTKWPLLFTIPSSTEIFWTGKKWFWQFSPSFSYRDLTLSSRSSLSIVCRSVSPECKNVSIGKKSLSTYGPILYKFRKKYGICRPIDHILDSYCSYICISHNEIGHYNFCSGNFPSVRQIWWLTKHACTTMRATTSLTLFSWIVWTRGKI